MKESDIIRRIAQRFPAGGSAVSLAIGDDAAALRGSYISQLITTDTLIEGVHFDLSYMSLADVGYKALAVNLSDINAMGGESVAALGTLGVPRGVMEADIEALLDGIAAALQLCSDAGQHCALIGGDTIASPQWVIGFTVLGTVDGKPLLRSGAKPGDIVWHSGVLGLSGVGLEELRRGGTLSPPAHNPQLSGGRRDSPPTITAHVRPFPPLTLGPWLQRSGFATAAQDLSDSLSQVALQLAGASGVGIELDFRGYQFAPEVLDYARATGAATIAELLLAQAEDYQLLFTTPLEFAEQIASAPVPCTRIGQIVEADRGSRYFDEHDEAHELRAIGFQHL